MIRVQDSVGECIHFSENLANLLIAIKAQATMMWEDSVPQMVVLVVLWTMLSVLCHLHKFVTHIIMGVLLAANATLIIQDSSEQSLYRHNSS